MTATSLELLQAMPIFGAIREDTLKFLLERAEEVSVDKDDYFFRENDQGSSMFVLEEGRVAVLKSWVKVLSGLASRSSFQEGARRSRMTDIAAPVS